MSPVARSLLPSTKLCHTIRLPRILAKRGQYKPTPHRVAHSTHDSDGTAGKYLTTAVHASSSHNSHTTLTITAGTPCRRSWPSSSDACHASRRRQRQQMLWQGAATGRRGKRRMGMGAMGLQESIWFALGATPPTGQDGPTLRCASGQEAASQWRRVGGKLARTAAAQSHVEPGGEE